MSKLYLIGNSHIDPVWLWRWQDGFSEIFATYRSALDRMKEFPDFKYTSACASYYQIVEKLDPDMFAEIQMRVKEGRWCITGGWFLQPDCNIPSGESLARHSLISQRYFKEKFGITAKTGYNVDSFGHNASIPKIMKASGMNSYVFMRPSPCEQNRDEYLFNWESNDGSAVTAYRIPISYGCPTMEVLTEAKKCVDNLKHDSMLFYGVGNHGGGPTIALINEIKKNIPDGIFATPDEFFDKLDNKEIPTISGELQHHARGCYSALTYIKKENRKCEQNLLAAEKLCAMSSKLTDYQYPKKKLNKAWKNLLFNQFHDILGGCSIKSAYNDASYLFGETMSITEQEMYFAMQKIVLNIDTLGDNKLPSPMIKNKKTWESEILGIPIVIFNPHTWKLKAFVSVNERATKVTGFDGKEVPFQFIRAEQTKHNGDMYYTSFIADIPPLGYATYRIFTKQESKLSACSSLSISNQKLENSRLCVEFDQNTGDICKLFDKELGEYVIKAPCRAILLDESDCDTWAHNKTSLGDIAGSFGEPIFEILEEGPVRVTLRTTVTFNTSTVTRDFSLLADDDRVYVKAKIDFHEKHRTLKFAFPMSKNSVRAKIPYGTVERNAYLGEEPCGSFLINGKLAVANDSKYGYDTESNEMRLTVLRGAVYADHYGDRDNRCEYMDQGVSEFAYSIFAHRSISDTEKKAAELNFAPRIIMASFHHGSLPETMACFECDDDTLIVTAIKKAEESDKTVIRCFDIDSKEHNTKITLFGKELSICLPHNAIKTFTEDGEELDLTEAPINS